MANITLLGVQNCAELHRGFQIDWQDPPIGGPFWSANVSSENPRLFALMRRRGSKVIRGKNKTEMLQEARAYVDTLLDGQRQNVFSVRDLFIEAQGKENRGVPPHVIRDYLVDRAGDLGEFSITDIGRGERGWDLTFSSTGEKIRFDGSTYFLDRR
jgi:hypothetical protein